MTAKTSPRGWQLLSGKLLRASNRIFFTNSNLRTRWEVARDQGPRGGSGSRNSSAADLTHERHQICLLIHLTF